MGFMDFKLGERWNWRNTANVITELSIGNFKAFGEAQRVPIKPLTLIFGANSSGKSSIIHALLLAHHGVETGEYDVRETKLAREMVDLGGFPNYLHKHDANRKVVVRLEISKEPKAILELDGWYGVECQPLCEWSRFGMALHIGLPGEDQLSQRAAPRPQVQIVDIFIDGAFAVRFSQGEELFRATSIELGHPLLATALASALKRSLSSGDQPLDEKLRAIGERRLRR